MKNLYEHLVLQNQDWGGGGGVEGVTGQGDQLSYASPNHRAKLFGTEVTHIQRHLYSTLNDSAS